ncbi:MAG: Wzz/FepE/Etk N-terminal domain-containing protein [Thermomicrobiales bacterium]|nr:Wzz/FepE/Etk N-terminal domain-containing protein [Thermomicrobiales bacterium]MCO5219216.1 Wzz/FepE/Etk N-terminal domain-containing protein [Thermomicrobiales bacterium]MCO5225065.1 Wzz/FepE/Etk N-terminal domain-containing protein [Thermomicrobiales bacterium]MCO5228117.1 Wzz/FepE/Etk N-terminal domain-containing protein [Thermomicrobiales bacterium]
MDIELSRIVRAIRRFWWIVLVSVVAFAGTAAAFSLTLPRTYTSGVTLLVAPSSISGFTLSEGSSSTQTLIQLATSDSVLGPVKQEFGIEGTLDELRQDVEVSGSSNTQIIRIWVTNEDAQRAADIANAIAEMVDQQAQVLSVSMIKSKRDDLVYQRDQIDSKILVLNQQIRDLESEQASSGTVESSRLAQLKDERLNQQKLRVDADNSIRSIDATLLGLQPPVVVTDAAVPARYPEGTSRVLLVAVGVVFGGFVGIAIMMWRELRDTRVRDARHVLQLTGAASVTSVSTSEDVHMAAARAAGVARKLGSSAVALVGTRASSPTESRIGELAQDTVLRDMQVVRVPGLLNTNASFELLPLNAVVMLFIEQLQTLEEDVLDTLGVLHDFGVVSVVPVLIQS